MVRLPTLKMPAMPGFHIPHMPHHPAEPSFSSICGDSKPSKRNDNKLLSARRHFRIPRLLMFASGATSEASTKEPTPSSQPRVERRRSSIRRASLIQMHTPNRPLGEVYDVEDIVLDKGGFGVVRRARFKASNKDNVECKEQKWTRAIKSIHLDPCRRRVAFRKVKEEVEIMKQLDHPNVCRIFETFEEKRRFHIVLELIEGQTLSDFVFNCASKGEDLQESVVADLTNQMLAGLRYCHCQGVVHADVKPENLMLVTLDSDMDRYCIKIIDFGLSTTHAMCHTASQSGAFRGTPDYAAPEVMKGEAHSPASDLWSAGMVLHVLLIGELPSQSVKEGEEPLQVEGNAVYDDISEHAASLLEGLVSLDQAKRLKSAEDEVKGEKSWTAWTTTGTTGARYASEDNGSGDNSETMPTSSLEAFTKFHQSSLLRKAVVTAMAMHLLESADSMEAKKRFTAMDLDGDGCLSKEELSFAVASRATESAAADIASWIEVIFDSMDTDGSGQIEYTEFLAAVCIDGNMRSLQAIEAAFRAFDLDGNGSISAQEFANVVDILPEDIVECMVEFDKDGDGEISYEEFKEIVSSIGAPIFPRGDQTSDFRRTSLTSVKSAPLMKRRPSVMVPATCQ